MPTVSRMNGRVYFMYDTTIPQAAAALEWISYHISYIILL